MQLQRTQTYISVDSVCMCNGCEHHPHRNLTPLFHCHNMYAGENAQRCTRAWFSTRRLKNYRFAGVTLFENVGRTVIALKKICCKIIQVFAMRCSHIRKSTEKAGRKFWKMCQTCGISMPGGYERQKNRLMMDAGRN